MDFRKRGGTDAIGNGAFKKSKLGFFGSPELDSLSSGIGSKMKPCTKFFSIAGCPFGQGCHFLHYYPGGYNAVAKLMNLEPIPTSQTDANGSSSAVKSRLCNKYSTTEGCKFGDKCHFAHGEWELGKPIPQSNEDSCDIGAIPGRFGARIEQLPTPPAFGAIPGRFGGRFEQSLITPSSGAISGRFGGRIEPAPVSPASTFGASATAKISVDSSHTGAIIGKGGMNSKQICRETGVKLAIRDHSTNSNLKNIELEGTFEQIHQASLMVQKLIQSIELTADPAKSSSGIHASPAPRAASNYKTKLCENLAKGSCTFGERCHFAHGEADLRKSGV
ncbi:C3H1-type domain-containing protein [Heracleum sosnowskyi]|uniref:C3H1-type domain-containing protein n=1 Tax=Heracleum sosnowskyi TaxID=360622 RepID=A0AAD8LY49_9APIA|nr:C3H1-type domain-containing protein [Heracleum sosnowskyi]